MRLFVSNALVIISFLCFCPAIGNGQLKSTDAFKNSAEKCPPSGTTMTCSSDQILICTSTSGECKCSCEPIKFSKDSIDFASAVLTRALEEPVTADKLKERPEFYTKILKDIANSNGEPVTVDTDGTTKEIRVKPSEKIEEKFNEKLLRAVDKLERAPVERGLSGSTALRFLKRMF